MLQGIERESVEAVLALLITAGSAGVIIGYGAATYPDVVGEYGMLATMGVVWFSTLTGRVAERLVEAGEIPNTGITVDAPNNATTGLYAIGAVVMLAGLIMELVFGSPNPVLLVLFVVGSAFCLERGFRRGTEVAGTGE